MLTDFVTRAEAGPTQTAVVPPAGTRVYLLPDPDNGEFEGAVVAALDAAGTLRLGLVAGDDKNRLYTRLQRGSIATAKVSTVQTGRNGIEIDVHMEDFGGGSAPSGKEVLPARPPRRTELVHFDGEGTDPARVKDWARQLLAKAGEAENRGEDLRAFADDQHAEIQAFERTLPSESAARFRQLLHDEVHELDDVPAPVYWMLGEVAPAGATESGGGNWLRWVVILVVVIVAYTWFTS